MEDKRENTGSFENSMERLEQIVRIIEQGEVPLEESLKLFEEGIALVRLCGDLLDHAQMRVTQVFPGVDGTPTETEFEDDD